MSLFDNGEPDDFILFQRNYQMILETLGNITAGVRIQYLRNLLHG